jgi:hypothetical protein
MEEGQVAGKEAKKSVLCTKATHTTHFELNKP